MNTVHSYNINKQFVLIALISALFIHLSVIPLSKLINIDSQNKIEPKVILDLINEIEPKLPKPIIPIQSSQKIKIDKPEPIKPLIDNEVSSQIVKNNMGITTAIGIGGDPIIGTSMKDALKMFENDTETKGIVLIGEIGAQMEIEAANWAKDNCSKPIVGFIAGQTAPPGRRMGHAGAIVSGGDETAQAKMKILGESGISVSKSVADIGATMRKQIEEQYA